MTPNLRWFPAAALLALGCNGEPATPTPATPPTTVAAAPPATAAPSAKPPAAPAPAPAAAPAPAPVAPAAAGGLQADPEVVRLIAGRTIGATPTIDDPFLPEMTRQFDPVPLGKWAKDPRVEAEVRRLTAPLVDADREKRADAAYALAELGPAVAIFLDDAIRELRAAAVARVDAMIAQTKQRLAAAGKTPEQVIWDPKYGQFEPTIVTLVRDLIDGDADQQAQAAQSLGEMEPHIIWMYHDRPCREILLEPARAALLATQRRIWRTGDVNRAAEWLALRLRATLWVDKAILAEKREQLRDRDYVDAKLVFDNLSGELLADYTTYGRGDQRGFVLWRPSVPPSGPGKPARPIGAELAATSSVATAYQMAAIAGGFDVKLAPAIDGSARTKFSIRTFDWVLLLFTLAEQLGHTVEEHPEGGFLIVKKSK